MGAVRPFFMPGTPTIVILSEAKDLICRTPTIVILSEAKDLMQGGADKEILR